MTDVLKMLREELEEIDEVGVIDIMAVEEAIDEIEQLNSKVLQLTSALYEHRWIPCEEEMPEPLEVVQVWNADIPEAGMYSFLPDADSWVPDWADTLINRKHVSHWRKVQGPEDADTADS